MPEHTTPHPDVGAHVLGLLTEHEDAAFRRHLDECSACRAEVAELANIPSLLRSARAGTAELPPGLRDRTLAAVEQSTPSNVKGWRRAVRIAAVLIAALGAAALLQANDNDASSFEATLVAERGQRGTGTAILRRTDSGIAVELAVAGLEATSADKHYECWYVSASEKTRRVSAGTFTVDDEGDATVRMVTAADPAIYPVIEVTLEADNGDPAPGAVVLTTARAASPVQD